MRLLSSRKRSVAFGLEDCQRAILRAIADGSVGIEFQLLRVCKLPALAKRAICNGGLRVVCAHNLQRAADVRQLIIAGLQEEVTRVEVHRLKADGTMLAFPQRGLIQQIRRRRREHIPREEIRIAVEIAKRIDIRKIDQIVRLAIRRFRRRHDHFLCGNFLAFAREKMRVPRRCVRRNKRLVQAYRIDRSGGVIRIGVT